MNRRDVVRGGLGLLTIGAATPSFAARPCPPSLDGAMPSSCTPQPNRIETFAAQMNSGSWGQLSPDGNGFKALSEYTGGSPSRSSLEYSNQIFWNASAKELHHRGGGASSGGGNAQRHLRYSEATGNWDAVTPWHTNWAHQWGNFTGDPATGNLYYRKTNDNVIHRWAYQPYPSTASSWSQFGTGGWPASTAKNAQCFEFFPDLNNGQGGLVFIDTVSDRTNVWTSDASLQNWQQAHSNVFGSSTQAIEQYSAYLPAERCILFGGGARAPFGSGNFSGTARLNADGSVQVLRDAPRAFGTRQPSMGTVVGHPNGRAFAISAAADTLYEYDAGADNWSNRGSLPFSAYWITAVMIPEYFAIYCLIQLGSGGSADVEEWMYRL